VNYPASLVPLQSVVEVELVIEDPFVSDDIRANGTRDKILNVFFDQDSNFFFHDALLRICKDGGDAGSHR
jgi:hypothetical protein